MNHRILFVTHSLQPLDDTYQLRLLAKHLASQNGKYTGNEIRLAVFHGHPDQVADLQAAGVKVDFLSSPTPPLPSLSLKTRFECARRLNRLVRRMNGPILHAWGEPAATIARFAARELVDSKLIASHLWAPDEWLVGKWILETSFARNADDLIVPDISIAEEFDEEGFDRDTVRAIPNGIRPLAVDKQQARQAILERLNLPAKTHLIGTVAPLNPKTRLKDLIWATDLLTCIRDDVHFVIFGSGTTMQEHALWRFKHCTEAPFHVHILDPALADRMLPGLDVYWHSHLQQPQPTGLLAAMRSTVPAISVYGAGTKDIIHHQETGFGVNFGARDEFARWTKYLLERPGDAALIARQGREHVTQMFDPQPMFDAYESLYAGNLVSA